MPRTISILIISIYVSCSIAQEAGYLELVKAEGKLQEMFEELYSDSLEDPSVILEQLSLFMEEALTMPGAMQYPWTRLDRIGVRTSADKQIRVFTWHVEDDPDHFRYFGYFQLALRRGKVSVLPLSDNFKKQRNLFRGDQSTEDWYGKLYYGIVENRVKRKTYYTLLGMDFNDSRSNIKTVEVLRIHRNEPQFVKEMFFNGRDRVDRVVLEYSSQVAITVRYDPLLDMIAFDHLVPFHEIYQGQFEFYGPDGSFDGLEFDDGNWIFREDIDARMEY